ncbi:MAG: xylulokinase [Sediminibacterium sp.]|jgi:xylulokinase
MYLLGIDIGTSSIKVSVVEANTSKCIATTQFPESETPITALEKGWAEQSPEMWWDHIQQAILKLHSTKKYTPSDISAIGISYQMHGLVLVDKNKQVLRDSIIWCDSRAVNIGEKAFNAIGSEKCLSHLLNSPGNFTASKLAWVKQNEPDIYKNIAHVMLPGDFVSMKFTGNVTTSISSLSEGIFWDFKNNELSKDVLNYYGIDASLLPKIQPVFSNHGELLSDVAHHLNLKSGIPITYKAGDQPNNALSLNVLEPGEVAATAGTSGVIYGVTDKVTYDQQSRVNTFAHVNHTQDVNRLGVLLCINGTGILNSWVKKMIGAGNDYPQMNQAAGQIHPGSDGLHIMPFGNGAERIFNNKMIGAHFVNLDFNKHSQAHIYRAAQEGIAFTFRYGIDIMRENGMNPSIIRAGYSNMFLSEVFTEAFVNATHVPVALYHTDGSVGAAIGAGIGSGIYKDATEAFGNFKPIKVVEPNNAKGFNDLYLSWHHSLSKLL